MWQFVANGVGHYYQVVFEEFLSDHHIIGLFENWDPLVRIWCELKYHLARLATVISVQSEHPLNIWQLEQSLWFMCTQDNEPFNHDDRCSRHTTIYGHMLSVCEIHLEYRFCASEKSGIGGGEQTTCCAHGMQLSWLAEKSLRKHCLSTNGHI